MNRIKFMAANWKMHKTVQEAHTFIRQLWPKISDCKKVKTLICPAAVHLQTCVEAAAGTAIAIGSQNMHDEDSGAFTGEISADMIGNIGCKYTIIGHSERRSLFAETDEWLNSKTRKALSKDLIPVFCIGETLEEREAGETNNVLEKQLKQGLDSLEFQAGSLLVAYEPVWAIGTGKVATPEQAQDAHAFVRGILGEMFGTDTAGQTLILYGGSVKPENVDGLISLPDIDGGLVGGASLKVDSFAKLVLSGDKHS